MEDHGESHRRKTRTRFCNDFKALFIKTLRLTVRKPGQTIVEILLAYAFMGFLLGMRYILDRRLISPYQIPRFRPQDILRIGSLENTTYYYPDNICASMIVNNTVNDLRMRWFAFPPNIELISDPTLSTLSSANLQSLLAVIQFTNLDGCTGPTTMPDEVKYTLRMQENGVSYYQAQNTKIPENDYLWKRSPQDFCRDTSSLANYYNQFLAIQYFLDQSIIRYVTNRSSIFSSNIFMNHLGCPQFYLDQLHSLYGFFIPIFFSIIFVVTFVINVGYIVEERENKTKEYLRIYGLRTWINNLVWVTRAMFIYFMLIGVMTALSLVVLPSSGARVNSVSKALFNYTDWTLLWTILFVYSIQVSAFSVLFGQFFKRPLLAKLIGFFVWVITLIDFYPGVSIGVRYFLCLFPNTALLFCIQVLLQYERENVIVTFAQLYSNLFPYPLYIGLCLLVMLVYSVIYLLLAIYIERINPGEFGVAQPWNYLFKRYYWKPQATAVVQPGETDGKLVNGNERVSDRNVWIELGGMSTTKSPSLSVSHLTKKFGKFTAVSDLSLNFYRGEVSSLLGHNGAGKTTATFILVGMLEPTSGAVRVEGLDNRLHIQEIRKILGFCPQYDILYNELSVEEHLKLIGEMRHMDPKVLKESIEHILHLIGLVNDRTTLSKDLSGGMKRRLSIGISLIGDPKVLILDEPTSGIDPYNRRLIWTIIRKMKDAGKCIVLTTHFLEEADILSDRIAIMTSGRLQACGTPDFLKSQIEFEYRLFVDKQDSVSNDGVIAFVQGILPGIVLERESASEMIFGIRRNESKQIGKLIHALDERSDKIGIESYGLSMTTIEEVFLKLIRQAEEEENSDNDQAKKREQLANRVFRADYGRETGIRRFWLRILALLIKRWHVLRRQYIFLLGFFLLPILTEILIVSVLPTPQQIQASLAQNGRVKDAKVTLLPSIYNPHTLVTYASSGNTAGTNLNNYLQSTGATVEMVSTDTLLTYIRDRYLTSTDAFINKYQMGFASYINGTPSSPALVMNSYYSTVNYHTMPTSLSVGSTALFQFYANSTAKKIITTNQPVLTISTTTTALQRFLEIIYCFDTLPLSLFNFINSVLAVVFVSILIVPLIQERISHSKDLQLLTNLTKRSYWLSNSIFDICSCFVLSILLTIVVKIGSVSNSDSQSEVHIYRNEAQTGCFLLMIIMYSLASLPLIYVYSFSPKSELIGFINYFVINVVACFLDMVLAFMALFSQGQSSLSSVTRVSRLTQMTNNIRWGVAVLFPSVNFKRSLYNIRLKSSPDCIASVNSLMLTNYSPNESWLSLQEPGIGIQLVIFCVQMVFWCLILTLIEKGASFKLACRRCCGCNNDLERADDRPDLDNENGADIAEPQPWDDKHLDEDVRSERRLVLQENPSTASSVILVRDLVQRFKKRKEKSIHRRIYTAVDHLTFRVTKRSCFGLLGANGAGKTTTFRMLINDLKPTSGEIIINGRNINKIERDLEIGFCPQFDWLVNNLTVIETLHLFARLKGLKWSEISQICDDILVLFGLEIYRTRRVQKLSGGNKRKVSAAVAFMANPALVFLDEPTTGLDAAAKRKLWTVIRAARDAGLTIILTSHNMEECEALCNKIGIMKLGQFMCLGNLQRLKNRFGNGYAVQVKLGLADIEMFKEELRLTLPGVQIDEQHNGILYCTVPFSISNTFQNSINTRRSNLAHIFDLFHKKKEEKSIESYSITQTTLEQIFIHLAGEDQYVNSDEIKTNLRQ